MKKLALVLAFFAITAFGASTIQAAIAQTVKTEITTPDDDKKKEATKEATKETKKSDKKTKGDCCSKKTECNDKK